ncbi:RagB/SusD family nutrient uptake outer membrane protein [Nafulsella turpanensis]|uniref:RagB/SusD family nutrient uptake outer membrane protein n=1 Tax=Nafulsella turpanensis TaxID=1265690 RepID=UPI0012695FFC|nr:RagB/SusD family nutrient uptake outer membrane protein [Nafulsella turpanensis]
MKNKFVYMLICSLLFSTTACDKEFLEIVPEDAPTVDGFYNSASEIRAVTATLYGRPWFEYNDKFSWAAGDGMAGDLFNDYQTEGQLFYLTYSDNNNIISQGWRGLYNVIAYANAIINDMPRVAGQNGVPQEVINAGLGEARFIRATAYYLLAEYWEEVPIIENVAALIESNNIDVVKNTYSSVIEFVIRDLEFAAEHLPLVDEPGRVTTWAAQGMLAKVHLTRAQREKSAEDFAKAAAYAKNVIENSGLFLLEDYSDLFRIENNNNPESLFALQWIGGAWGFGNSRQAVMGRSSLITGNSEAWGGYKGVTIDYMDNVEENAEGGEDLRQPWIYMELGDFYPEIRKDAGGYTYNIVTPDPAGGGNLENPSPLLNNVKKYVVGSSADLGGIAINNQAVPLNQYMLRLADVYLIYAEAVLGMAESTSDPLALAYFNAVRERAGLEPRTSITYRDIFNERRVEFGMEGIAWLDVKRYFYHDPAAAIAYLNAQDRAAIFEPIEGYEGDVNSWEAYEIVPPATPVVIDETDMVLPIPNGEIGQNPNLGPGVEAVEYIFE